MLDVSEKLSKIYGQLGPVRYFLTSINANYKITSKAEVSKDIEVIISDYMDQVCSLKMILNQTPI